MKKYIFCLVEIEPYFIMKKYLVLRLIEKGPLSEKGI